MGPFYPMISIGYDPPLTLYNYLLLLIKLTSRASRPAAKRNIKMGNFSHDNTSLIKS